jgi:hypothetical protein
MTTIINGSSPSVTFSDGTTQTTAGLPLTGGTVTGNVTATSFIPTSNTAPTNGLYLPAANTIGIATNSGSKWQVNSSGAVTAPNQPAFFAGGTGGTVNYSVGSYVAFNTLLTTFAGSNRNSGFNTGTYLYTAPIAGLYFFYTQLYLNPNSTSNSFTWWKNGAQLSYADAANNVFMATNSSTTPSNIILNGSVTLELAASDTVGIQVRTTFGTAQVYMGHSSFFGYLIG